MNKTFYFLSSLYFINRKFKKSNMGLFNHSGSDLYFIIKCIKLIHNSLSWFK